MCIPGVNVIAMLTLVFREWPIHRELADLRTRCGQANETDAYLVLQEALRLELKGRTDDALLKYQEVASRFRGTAAGTDAEKSVGALQKQQGIRPLPHET